MIQTNELTQEMEELWRRIAAIDGWVDIEKKEVEVFSMLWGKSKKRNPIPDYPSDQNAITALFKERGLYYQVAWMPTQQCARANDINDREFKGETEAIALCRLFLAIQENK